MRSDIAQRTIVYHAQKTWQLGKWEWFTRRGDVLKLFFTRKNFNKLFWLRAGGLNLKEPHAWKQILPFKTLNINIMTNRNSVIVFERNQFKTDEYAMVGIET